MSKGPSPTVRESVIRRDGYACRYCGAVLLASLGIAYARTVTLDHIIPRSRAGSHTPRNLVVSCSACNHRKADTPGGLLYPPRFFDDTVERALLFHAGAEGWKPQRIADALTEIRPKPGRIYAEAVGEYAGTPASPTGRHWGDEHTTAPDGGIVVRGNDEQVTFQSKGLTLAQMLTRRVERTDAGSGIKPGRLRLLSDAQRSDADRQSS